MNNERRKTVEALEKQLPAGAVKYKKSEIMQLNGNLRIPLKIIIANYA